MNIHVTIKEDGETGNEITLKEVNPGVYKINHPNADPNRIFLRNGIDINELVMYALIHLNIKK